jgi:hypothetical protein
MTITSFTAGIVAKGIAAALAVWLAEEHGSSVRLQAENAALREQITRLGQAQQSTPAAVAASADSEELEKLRAEHAELLRLRGEVGLLRNEMERNKAELATTKTERDQMVAVEKAQALRAVTVNALKQIGIACRFYANSNGNVFPTSFAQLEDQLAGLGVHSGVGTNTFEIYDYGQPLSTSAAPYSLFAREKEASQMPDGSWSRAYLMVDGSVQEATPDNGDFDLWETDWIQKMAFRYSARQAAQQAAFQAAVQAATQASGQPSQ